MLGFVTALIGAMFVIIGVNAAVRTPSDDDDRPPSPVTGLGYSDRAPSPRTRLYVGIGWMVVGVLFIVAAFTHNVP